MKRRIHLAGKKGLAAALMAAALTVTGILQVFGAVNGNGLDTIDESKKCSLHIYKYDQISSDQLNDATGERDTSIETAMQSHAIKGVEFTVLRVGDIQMRSEPDGAREEVEVYYSLPDQLAVTDLGINAETAVTIAGQAGKKYYTSDVITGALEQRLTADSIGIKNRLKTYADNPANSGQTVTTNDNGLAELSGLSTGLYLIVETAVPQNITSTTNPFFVSLPMTDAAGDQFLYDIYVYPKNQNDVPTIDKVVKPETEKTYADYSSASVGDLLEYRVVTKVAPITDSATYYSTWQLTDVLTDGLDYVDITDKDNTIVQAYDTEAAAKQGGSPSASLQFTADDYDIAYTAGTKSCKVGLNKAGLAKLNQTANSGKFITFSYRAKLNRQAVLGDAAGAGTGNDNTASLTWGRSNETYTQTLKDTARVYAYALDITKLLSDSPEQAAQLLPTVEFTLYDETRKHHVSGDKINSDTYKVNDQHTADYIFSPSGSGKLKIEGLAAGTYTLMEVKSASGYALLKKPISIVITSSEATALAETAGHNNQNAKETNRGSAASVTTTNSASASVDGNEVSMTAYASSANAVVNVEITNTKSWIPYLPKTGGMGSLLLVIAGAVLIGAGLNIGLHSKTDELTEERL